MYILSPVPDLIKSAVRHKVELTDMNGKSFRIELSLLPVFGMAEIFNQGNRTFKVLDPGYIKFHSGGCLVDKTEVGFSTLFLDFTVAKISGIRLKDFYGRTGTIQRYGEGIMSAEWVIGFKPGKIGWILL